MLKFRTLALLALVPVAACSGTATENGDGGDQGGGSGGTGGSGVTGGASGTAQGGTVQGGAGPVGGTPPTGGVPQGGASGTAGVSGTPSGGTSGTGPIGGTAGSGVTGGVAGAGPAGTGGTPPGGQGGTAGGASGTGGSAAGTAGVAGMPVNCPAAPTSDTLVGWATQGGTTTGGGNGSPTPISSASASQLTDNTARVLSFSSLSGTVRVGSNKTLQGANGSATINGKIEIQGSSNIILRNFRINASSSGDDGVTIQDSNHIWISHLEIYDAEDGNMDITDGSDYITVSWTKFRYSSTGDHNFSNLIASADDDTGNYRITFHHNWWANNVSERMPRVRFGQVHVFNNYYGVGTGAPYNDHCIRAAFRANVRAESNYFDIVRTPHEIAEDSSGAAILQATTCANNTSVGSAAGCNIEYLSLNTGGNPVSRGTAFNPPYNAGSSMTVADCVKAHVTNAQTGAGPH